MQCSLSLHTAEKPFGKSICGSQFWNWHCDKPPQINTFMGNTGHCEKSNGHSDNKNKIIHIYYTACCCTELIKSALATSDAIVEAIVRPTPQSLSRKARSLGRHICNASGQLMNGGILKSHKGTDPPPKKEKEKIELATHDYTTLCTRSCKRHRRKWNEQNMVTLIFN